MKKHEISQLLGVLAMADNRQGRTDEDVLLWSKFLPEDLDLQTALDAVVEFYRAPAETFEPKLTSRQLMRFVRKVKHDRRLEVLRANAVEASRQAPALEERRKNLRRIGGLGLQLKHPDDH